MRVESLVSGTEYWVLGIGYWVPGTDIYHSLDTDY
jgi:hypothetical protein